MGMFPKSYEETNSHMTVMSMFHIGTLETCIRMACNLLVQCRYRYSLVPRPIFANITAGEKYGLILIVYG